MIGAIIGDIVGSRFEFGDPPQENFELFTPECNFTDDTICTVAIADAVMNGKSYKESLQYWCRRYPDPMGGYGSRFYSWFNSDNPQPNNSCGNGSAMRVSPIGWLFDDINQTKEEARKSAEVSHNHEEGIKGAECVASLIHWLRTCRVPKEKVESRVKRIYGYEIPSLKDIYRIGRLGHFDATCQETVPMAVRCFLESNNFEEAIRLSVMVDGDTDTKADITGAIAAAYYDVPDDMVEKALSYLPGDILDIVEQFYNKIHGDVEE